MPGKGNIAAGKGALGAVGAVRSFFGVVKEIDFDEVRDRAETRPRIVVIGPQEADAHSAAERVFGSDNEAGVEYRAADRRLEFDRNRYDAAIVIDPHNSGLIDDVKKFVGSSWAPNVFELRGAQGATDRDERVRLQMSTALPHLAPSLGRHFESFRPAAVRAIIDETSRVNGKFALISNVPSIVPIFGSFVAASADVIVLTKNQIMMCYKIAAVHNRDLNNQLGVIRELVPVVGAGFLWRTIAREAASFIPFAAGTVPKVVVAYAGTYSVGHGTDFYYRFGKKPSAAQLRTFSKQAVETALKLPFLTKDKKADSAAQSGTNPTEPITSGELTTKLDQ
ncbi:MAG: hypothetical protein WKF81_12945 [Thermomicrobiales bacterium]